MILEIKNIELEELNIKKGHVVVDSVPFPYLNLNILFVIPEVVM